VIFPVRCRTSEGEYPREGLLLAIVEHGQPWAVVVWDDEEDPTTVKANCIDIEVSKWTKLTL